LSTFFASPAVKIHQIKKHVLFNSRPKGKAVRVKQASIRTKLLNY
jgi:hypothetical protein